MLTVLSNRLDWSPINKWVFRVENHCLEKNDNPKRGIRARRRPKRPHGLAYGPSR